MVVAENCLAYDLVADRVARAERLTWPDMAYPDNTGTEELRCAFARYIERHLVKVIFPEVKLKYFHFSHFPGSGFLFGLPSRSRRSVPWIPKKTF